MIVLLTVSYFILILEGERAKRFFKMQPIDVNYDRKYYQNTFISATRAMSDYLLKPRYGTKHNVCLASCLFMMQSNFIF